MTTCSRLLVASLLLGALAVPSSAMAGTIFLPTPPGSEIGFAHIAEIYGKIYLRWTTNKGAPCTWWKLSDDTKLHEEWVIQGTSKRELMQVLNSTSNFYTCGTVFPVKAPDQQNFALELRGNGGDDTLYGASLDGGSGNDYLVNRPARGWLSWVDNFSNGGSGNDTLRGNNPDAWLIDDGGGNDKLCVDSGASVWAGFIDDGTADTYCGTFTSGIFTDSLDTHNCSVCN